jgi:hypothetical protein
MNLQPIFLNNIKLAKNKSIEPWKTYRWIKWAVENDKIKPHGRTLYKINNVNYY